MIYLDNHSTTPCDPAVVEAMLPWLADHFANPHSAHAAGVEAADAIANAAAQVERIVGTKPDSAVFTSGATESNNLAIRGVCTHPRMKRRHIVTVATEHPAVLDVCKEMEADGFRVTVAPVHPADHQDAGVVDLDQLDAAVDDDTALVSVMWANNEIGTIAPMLQIAEICHSRGALLHTDATQAVGRIPVHMIDTDVDLLSASAHKIYGPKSAGLLMVNQANRRIRLRPQITGGGQQRGLRSGTVSPASVVAIETALRLCKQHGSDESARVRRLRDHLWEELRTRIEGLVLNGPSLENDSRLAGNLNVVLPRIEGEAWVAAVPEVAFSTGSACSDVDPAPSHVLTAIGRDESQARRSVRFGVGRFNTEQEVDAAIEFLVTAYDRISQLAG